MPLPVINFDFSTLKEYFFGKRRHMYYDASVKKRREFLPHSDGVYPQAVIERQRPNEPEIVKQFRAEIWEPITKPKFTQIISSLSKIRRSADWAIKYPQELGDFNLIRDDESLEVYTEKEFPFFGSITNWVFSVLIKTYLIDPNAAVMELPLTTEIEANEYMEPYPYLFSCEDVYDFVPGRYAILRNPKGSTLYPSGGSFFVVNTRSVQVWEQSTSKAYRLTSDWVHGQPEMPVFKLGGIISESYGSDFLFESRIAGVLPNLNEAVAEYTDLQAAKRLHVYPERWEYSQHECSTCKGIGQVKNPNYMPGGSMPVQYPCGTCGGLGYVSANGPYSKVVVKPVQAGTTAIPTPPAGFIEKDVEIVRIMDESWRRHIYDALAAINFQFLDQTPLNQSGTAKEVDKEELNNTVHSIAEDIIRIMDRIYRHAAIYRYGRLYGADQIEQMLPTIPVPGTFDLLSSQFMQEEVGKAKNAKLNATIVNAMEIEFTSKRFINEPQVKDMLELILRLDPLPNVTEDEKMSMLSNKGITLVNYIISSNIHSFVQRALEEDDDFATLELQDQVKVLRGYAQEQIDEQQTAAQAAMQAQQDQNTPQEVPTEENEFIEEEEQITVDA